MIGRGYLTSTPPSSFFGDVMSKTILKLSEWTIIETDGFVKMKSLVKKGYTENHSKAKFDVLYEFEKKIAKKKAKKTTKKTTKKKV